eukprot:758797-Hanusia_phi.AAC.4
MKKKSFAEESEATKGMTSFGIKKDAQSGYDWNDENDAYRKPGSALLLVAKLPIFEVERTEDTLDFSKNCFVKKKI